VNVDAYPDKTFKGRVESVSPATGARFSMLPPDNATGNFVKVTQRVPVRIAFAEAADVATPLRAGMSVKVLVNDKI
jgi:membrane fusion protein, multidrug efflux system